MQVSETDERAFEKLIELSLVGSTREEREAEGVTDPEVQLPEANQYYWGVPSDMDKVLALDVNSSVFFFPQFQTICFSVSCSHCCFLTWIQVSQEAGM